VPTGRGPTPHLPEPTGPYPAGTASVWLTDTSRPDPWVPGVTARELMVSVWYPAVPSDGRRARYITPAESDLQLSSRGITGVPPDALIRELRHGLSRRAGYHLPRPCGTSAGQEGGGSGRPGRVRAFFDQHLRGRPQALLDQPSPRHPEVTFCSP
jgi:hypothetical protein